jgi:16S rRNA U1498 N3-methylase RsmE
MLRKKIMDIKKMSKKELVAEVLKWRRMYTASIEQAKEAQYTEVELENYKGYLKETRERVVKVRLERDLAIKLLHLRLTPHDSGV